MVNLKEYVYEGLADWSDNELNKKISKQTTKAAIKQEIIDWIMENYMTYIYPPKKIVKNKLKFTFDNDKIIVDYDLDIRAKNKNIEYLTNGLFQWGEIGGHFDCSGCINLKSLEGGPVEASIFYDCRNCIGLTSLKGAPKKTGIFDCSECIGIKSLENCPECHTLTAMNTGLRDLKYLPQTCKDLCLNRCVLLKSLDGLHNKITRLRCDECDMLKDLKGCPKEMVEFDCSDCKNLETLEGGPKIVKNFYCVRCPKLTTLEGGPEEVSHKYECQECHSLVSLKGAPKHLNILSINNCSHLETLEGGPEEIDVVYARNCHHLKSLDGPIIHRIYR